MDRIRVTQVKSTIKTKDYQKATIKALGLGRPNYYADHILTPQISGMINSVKHLVKIEKINI